MGESGNLKTAFLSFVVLILTAAQWTDWQVKSGCSSPCGVGNQTEVRSCQLLGLPSPFCKGDSTRVVTCYGPPCKVDGHWSEWKDWTPCSQTCGQGVAYRVRLCNNPSPSYGGSVCSGANMETKHCNVKSCQTTTTTSAPPQFVWKTVIIPSG